ncbi:MAG: ATP-dependent helicase [Phycisphaerales bacterium]
MTIALSTAQQSVVDSRGEHLQVIACAGSGKTEAVSRRVAGLVADGEAPASIVAFTFTERAAAELKSRIAMRVEERCGREAREALGPMFVGTIHGYCLQLLQFHVPKYGDFDILDPNRHAALLARERKRLGIDALMGDRKWQGISEFASNVDVIGNELITPEQLDGHPIGEVYRRYLEMLERYHFLTFGLIIQKAVEALRDPVIRDSVRGTLRHLIVDEYQDINPAQEALIRELGADPVQVCVVGDDDQSIYQWRGSDVSGIQQFTSHFAGASRVTLAANRRSRGGIVRLAASFAEGIEGRLEKRMEPVREDASDAVVRWSAETPQEEAAEVAAAIKRLHEQGHRYGDIAILLRSVRTAGQPFVDALRQAGIPVACGGRTGLFMTPEMNALGMTYCWLADSDWRRERFGEATPTDLTGVATALRTAFGSSKSQKAIERLLEDWKRLVQQARRATNLIDDYYMLLRRLDVHTWDADAQSDRLGTLARFSAIIADYEHVTLRGRFVEEGGERAFRGGQNTDEWFMKNFAQYLTHFARDAYEEFEGEDLVEPDAVSIMTVHGAKGLEWPVVFMPGLQDSRFPSRRSGQGRTWMLPDDAISPAVKSRYEGGENEERRLFYVAMTRARDRLYLSNFERQKNRSKPSRFLEELNLPGHPSGESLPTGPPSRPSGDPEVPPLVLALTELIRLEECGYRYRLGAALGFQNRLVPELGYGRAIHHVLRLIADLAKATGRVPTTAEAAALLDEAAYFPFANRPSFDMMLARARVLVEKYVMAYSQDLSRVWATERPFELYVDGGTLTGRADVILDHHEGRPDSLALLDYKTTQDAQRQEQTAFQLRVYAAAGRAEGLAVDGAYLHQLDDGQRVAISVERDPVGQAVAKVESLMEQVRQRRFEASPQAEKCKRCDYRSLCRHAPIDPYDDD